MNHTETAKALAAAASYDSRTVGKADVVSWQKVLSDCTLRDVIQAIDDHYRATDERATHSAIRARVVEIRGARLAGLDYGVLTGDVHFDHPDWVKILQARVAAVRDGASIPDAIRAIPPDPTKQAAALAADPAWVAR